jgi:hypothetical protein
MPPAPRIQTTPDVVLASLLVRLQSFFSLDESHCYYTAEAVRYAQIPKGGDLWIEVSDGGGQFDPAQQIGGGAAMCTESALVVVTGYARVLLDAAARMDRRANDPRRGLLPLKGKILQALVDYDLPDPNGNAFLREPLHAVKSWPLDWNRENNCGSIAIAFHVEFDWDLAGGPP